MNFNLKAFARWLYLDCRTNWMRYFLISFGVHFIFMAQIIVKTLLTHGGNLQANTLAFYSLGSLNSSVAIYVASSFFKEFHDKAKAPIAMLLPVSQVEKFLGKLMLSLVIWHFASFSLKAMASLLPMADLLELEKLLSHLKTSRSVGFRWSNFISPGHALFFASGVFFSKAQLLKTLAATVLYLTAFGFIFFVIIPQSAIYLNWPQNLMSSMPHINYRLIIRDEALISTLENGYILFAIAFCLLIYFASWFKFRELEVK